MATSSPRKPSSIRHTRAIQRDRTHRVPPAPPADQVAAHLTDLIAPATFAQVAAFQTAGLRRRALTLPVVLAGADGRQRELLCLPLSLLPGWLFSIQPNRVKPDLAPKLRRYRAECLDVLLAAFRGDVMPSAPPSNMSGAELALEIAPVVQHLARQQVEMERQIGDVAGRQEVMAEYMHGFISGDAPAVDRARAAHRGHGDDQRNAGRRDRAGRQERGPGVGRRRGQERVCEGLQ